MVIFVQYKNNHIFMKNSYETYTARIFLNDKEAKKSIESLENKLSALSKLNKKASDTGDYKTANQLKKQIGIVTSELNTMKTSAQKVNHVLENLSGASYKDIAMTIKSINKELRSGAIERGSEEWKSLNVILKQCKEELKEINEESFVSNSQSKTFLEKANDIGFFLTNLIGVSGGLSDLSGFVNESINSFAAMDEEMVNVQKYTGLTNEQVKKLNEAFQSMDTRTSREELNQLAGAAGRLGITSTKEIEQFVSAADKINVALGDDLGDGAVDQIGKLAMAFGEDDRMGLNAAMLATGSAVNELAQNSAAGAGYLVDFTARVAGIGKQVGLTQADIMGFAAVMDENMLRDEMASTAFSNMMSKMRTETSKFAKFAGMDVKSFTNLVNTDFNEAVLSLAENLKKQNPEDMFKMLNDMGLDGSRAVSVLSNLADKIDDVKSKQLIANQAYQEGTSVMSEFDKANSSAQAKLEKAQKTIHELSIKLGEELYPATTAIINSGGIVVSVLTSVISFVGKYSKAIIYATTMIGLMNAVIYRNIILLKMNALWTKLVTLAIAAKTQAVSLAKTAMILLNGVLRLCTGSTTAFTAALRLARIEAMKNPYTLLASVLIAASVAIYGFISNLKSSSDEMGKMSDKTQQQIQKTKLLKDVTDNANSSVAEETTKITSLRKILNDTNKKYDERKRALDQLKKIVPDYHAKLTSEGKLVNDNSIALDNYCKNLTKTAKAQAAFSKMVGLSRQLLDHETLLNNRKANQDFAKDKLASYGYDPDKGYAGYKVGMGFVVSDGAGNQRKLNEEEQKEVDRYIRLYNYNKKRISQEQAITSQLEKQINLLQLVVEKNGGMPTNDSPTPTPSYVSDADKKEKDKEESEAESKRKETMRKEIDDEKTHADNLMAIAITNYAKGTMTYSEYQQERHRITIDSLQKQIDIYRKYNDNTKQLEAKLAEEQLSQRKDASNKKIKELDDEYKQEQIKLQSSFYDSSSRLYQDKELLDEALFLLEMEYMDKKKSMMIKGSEEASAMQADIDEKEARHKLQRETGYQKKLLEYRNQYLNLDNKKQMEIALKGWDELHQQGLMSEEEYQRIKLAIQAKYIGDSNTDKNSSFDTKVANAITVAESKSDKGYDKSKDISLSNNPIVGQINQYRSVMDQLRIMRDKDAISHREYEAAKAKVTSDFLADMVSKTQAAYDSVNNIINAASSFYSAQSQYEQSITSKKYDDMIAKAGNNSAKAKKLEEMKQKELAKIKSKYNKKQMKIELAQAFASTAMAAINSYASASKEHWLLGAVAAAMATSAGMLQIAAIKKQHAAEEAGYYDGGYTGGSSYRREAGVVHEGEFVANHNAVNNKALKPALDLIDRAQRNNTVASLTAQDISRALGQGSAAVVSAPVINVTTDNTDIESTLMKTRDSIDELTLLLSKGIKSTVSIDGHDGVAKQLELYNKIKSKG